MRSVVHTIWMTLPMMQEQNVNYFHLLCPINGKRHSVLIGIDLHQINPHPRVKID